MMRLHNRGQPEINFGLIGFSTLPAWNIYEQNSYDKRLMLRNYKIDRASFNKNHFTHLSLLQMAGNTLQSSCL